MQITDGVAQVLLEGARSADGEAGQPHGMIQSRAVFPESTDERLSWDEATPVFRAVGRSHHVLRGLTP